MSEAAPAANPAPSARRKLVLPALLVVLLAAGGGAWYTLAPGHAAQQPAQPKPAKKPLFTTLEPFTVNLQDARGERFAQIGVTLQFEDPDTESAIKDRLPAVRHSILMLISAKQVEDLLSVEGKQQLAQQIRLLAGRALGLDLPEPGAAAGKGKPPENPIRAVLFSQFIVQ